MPLPDDDPFAPILKAFLNSNYDPLLVGPVLEQQPAAAIYPLRFYDRHTASNLLLKSIKPAPWLPERLAAICDNAIEEYISAGHTFDPHGFPHQCTFPAKCSKSTDIEQVYHYFIAEQCCALTTKLLFTPKDPGWFSFILYYTVDSSFNTFKQKNIYEVVNPEPTKKPAGAEEEEEEEAEERQEEDNDPEQIPLSILEGLDAWVIPAMSKLHERPLASSNFYILTKQAETLLQKMGPVKDFKWQMPTAKGYPPTQCSPVPADSSCLTDLFPSLARDAQATIRESKGPKSKSDKLTSPTKKSKIVAASRITKARQQRYRPDPNHFIQEAWNQAVASNATFLIINCGRYERIGIRHRKTQTLYLSDIIRPGYCEEPRYGKMHLGLTIAIMKDALDRFTRPSANTAQTGSKRGLDDSEAMHEESREAKRRKHIGESCADRELFELELSKRDLLLYSLDHLEYQSPAPSSFYRLEPSCVPKPFSDVRCMQKRKASYSIEEYIAVIADRKPMARGATGIVYRVSVEVGLQSGEKMRRDMVMKLILMDNEDDIEAKARMVHEYNIYKHLAASGVVNGILSVHGLFQDAETGALAMLMDDAGKSLRFRLLGNPEDEDEGEISLNYDSNDEVVITTETQRDAFLAALDGIHKANVLHEDLRADNLLIRDDDQVYIIDFDCAVHDPDTPSRHYKIERSQILGLTGWHTHGLPDSAGSP